MYKGGALAGTSWSFSTKKTSYNLKGEKLASKNWIRIKYLFVSIYLFFTLKIGIKKAIYYSKRRATNENNYFLILEQSNTFKTTTSKKGHVKNGTLWYTMVHYGTLWYTMVHLLFIVLSISFCNVSNFLPNRTFSATATSLSATATSFSARFFLSTFLR